MFRDHYFRYQRCRLVAVMFALVGPLRLTKLLANLWDPLVPGFTRQALPHCRRLPVARGIRRRALLSLGLFVCVGGVNPVPAFAQGIISTVAGSFSPGFSGDGGPAVSAQLNITGFTGGVAADATGNLYIADTGNHRVRKIDPNGIISTMAGNGAAGFSGDGGPATSASLFAPTGLGLDAAANLYIVDTGNQRIRRVGPGGIVTTVAGNGGRGFSGDGGMATAASLSLGNVQYLGIAGYPTSVAVDGAGNLYIADTDNGRVRKVNPAGIISSAITGLRDPYGVAADAVGNLFITDSSNDRILKVSPGGVVTTIAGTLYSPSGVAVDRAGNLYIADSHSHRVRKVEPNGFTTIVAGSGDPIFDPIEGYYFVGGYTGDGGPATSAQLNFPWGVAVNAAGNIYIADSLNNRIRKVSANTGSFSNPIDDAQFFIRQHYLDFLNRPADDLGLAFWTNQITECGSDVQCIEIRRINVSAAFFLSIEFQETGYLVYRMYKAAYGDMPATPVPLTRQEFLPDTQRVGQGVVVGAPGWEQQLENNKNTFASEFVARSRFTTAFPPGLTAEQFVDALNANAGGVLSQGERDQLVSELTSGAKTRAQVLRSVAEDADLARNEFNKAFVLMQYFGYLRRNPNDPPDADFAGYDFWLNKLNQFKGNFVQAEMVKAFISSGEYRQRFGQP